LLRADAIVACGQSGLIPGGAVSSITGVPLLAIRKEGEPTIAGGTRTVHGIIRKEAVRWIWFDDVIDSGGTFQRSAAEAFNAELISSPLPCAIILHHARRTVYRPTPLESWKRRVHREFEWPDTIRVPVIAKMFSTKSY
jgi:hypothetical protein